jgi:hypothetical protein
MSEDAGSGTGGGHVSIPPFLRSLHPSHLISAASVRFQVAHGPARASTSRSLGSTPSRPTAASHWRLDTDTAGVRDGVSVR